MYKLLIADDEQVIREGLRDIIDWNSLGFMPVATFVDGQDIIDYLENNSADLIVTDIKMTKKSGLDVAEYVCKKNLSTKIILISGYKEVDLAMSAIKFNVQKYVLKPIDIDILTKSLQEVKYTLDKEAEAQFNNVALVAMESGIHEIKDNFFAELMMSSFKNEHYINSMFHFLFPKLKIEENRCFMTTLTIDNYQDFVENNWTHTNSDLYTCLKNTINLAFPEIEYRMITKNHNCLQLLGIVVSHESNSQDFTNEHIDAANKKLCMNLKETLSSDFTVTGLEIFNNISELLHYRSNNQQEKTVSDSLMVKINEQQKMIYSTIFAGNIAATDNLIRKFMEYMQNLTIDTVHSIVAGLLETIKNKLQESMDITSSLLIKEGYRQIFDLTNLIAIEDCLNHLVLDLLNLVKELHHDECNVMEQARKYITEHIMEDISLEDVAEKFYMSQYYFSRIFKAKTGENFIDFVIHNKMEYAITLMKIPQYKIYEISIIIGYKSNAYFTKIFKNYTGYTPNAYRKLLSPDPLREVKS